MKVLGVPVSIDLFTLWGNWLAPEVQPFFVDSLRPWPKSVLGEHSLSRELSDTFRGWKIDRSLKTLWLDEAAFLGMSREHRSALVRAQVGHGRGAVPSVGRWSNLLDPVTLRSQADGHRFVWWPSLVTSAPREILSRVIATAPDGSETPSLPSRHLEVERATWKASTAVLPNAKQIAGSFIASSGPNCFGTVMGAAGMAGADDELMLQQPFLQWLDSACRPGGRDGVVGTVLVWRDTKGVPVHAAVTLGGGWALEKASGEWWTPRAVRSVKDVIRTARMQGQRLERHRITGVGPLG